MAQPKGQELGVRTPFDLRVGIDTERFVGVQTQKDPGAIAKNAFQRARNIRLRGGMPVERGGQSKVITTPIDSAWDGLFDAGSGDGSLRLYLAGLPVNSLLWSRFKEATGDDYGVYGYRSAWSPAIAGFEADNDTPYRNYTLRFFSDPAGNLYAIGYLTTTLHFFSVQMGVGENPDALTLLAINESAYAANDPFAVTLDDGTVFFTTRHNGSFYGIYRYAPGEPVILDGSGWSGPGFIGTNGSDVYWVSPGEPTQRFLKRNNGAWTLLSYPAALDDWNATGNFWGSDEQSVGVRLGSVLYFVGQADNGVTADRVIVSINDTTVAYQTILTVPYGDGQALPNSEVGFNGLIYWLQRRSSADRLVLAESNGTTYVERANFTTLFGISKSITRACLIAGGANLYLIASPSTGTLNVYKSDGTDTTSWSLIATRSVPSAQMDPITGSGVAFA